MTVLMRHSRLQQPVQGLPLTVLLKLKNLTSDQTVLIIGAGGVGLAAVGMAKAVLKSRITVADVDPLKKKAAL